MKLTTRSRYGLRAITYIAKHSGGTPVPLSKIANELQLSDHYLEQLLRLLKKDGIIESVRGTQGGYLLAKPMKDITVTELLQSLEGPLWLSDCVQAGDCPNGMTNCATRMIISKLSEAIRQASLQITLADMIEHENAV